MGISFAGALLAIRGIELLLVVVAPSVLEDPYEVELILLAFELRFVRPVVLIARTATGAPSYRSRGRWAQLVGRVPLDSIAWQRYRVASDIDSA